MSRTSAIQNPDPEADRQKSTHLRRQPGIVDMCFRGVDQFIRMAGTGAEHALIALPPRDSPSHYFQGHTPEIQGMVHFHRR